MTLRVTYAPCRVPLNTWVQHLIDVCALATASGGLAPCIVVEVIPARRVVAVLATETLLLGPCYGQEGRDSEKRLHDFWCTVYNG